jgi:hypothetical protein
VCGAQLSLVHSMTQPPCPARVESATAAAGHIRAAPDGCGHSAGRPSRGQLAASSPSIVGLCRLPAISPSRILHFHCRPTRAQFNRPARDGRANSANWPPPSAGGWLAGHMTATESEPAAHLACGCLSAVCVCVKGVEERRRSASGEETARRMPIDSRCQGDLTYSNYDAVALSRRLRRR